MCAPSNPSYAKLKLDYNYVNVHVPISCYSTGKASLWQASRERVSPPPLLVCAAELIQLGPRVLKCVHDEAKDAILDNVIWVEYLDARALPQRSTRLLMCLILMSGYKSVARPAAVAPMWLSAGAIAEAMNQSSRCGHVILSLWACIVLQTEWYINEKNQSTTFKRPWI